jgi:hypothetical protein
MPATVKRVVGSFSGTREALGYRTHPFEAKKET